MAVAVQQVDRVLAQPERRSSGAVAQAADRVRGAGGGDDRVIGEQREPGQLQVQQSPTSGPGRRAAPGGEQRPSAHSGQGCLLAVAERGDPPGRQRVSGQRQACRVIQVRVGVQQPQATQPDRRPAHLPGELLDHRFAGPARRTA